MRSPLAPAPICSRPNVCASSRPRLSRGRTAGQPIELGGYLVPQGTEVYTSSYHTHHMAELYAEPERLPAPKDRASMLPQAGIANCVSPHDLKTLVGHQVFCGSREVSMAHTAHVRVPSGPPPLPIIGWRGNLLQFFQDPIAYMTQLAREHGLVAAFTKGGNGNLAFSKPELKPS
ncbi:MAG: cytochrome P450, partial [Roseiflexaceae bacterium]|nr:cytochrome P450 [Roseiflexaceae bacterium]